MEKAVGNQAPINNGINLYVLTLTKNEDPNNMIGRLETADDQWKLIEGLRNFLGTKVMLIVLQSDNSEHFIRFKASLREKSSHITYSYVISDAREILTMYGVAMLRHADLLAKIEKKTRESS